MDPDLFDIEERFPSSQLRASLFPEEPTVGSMSLPRQSVALSRTLAEKRADPQHRDIVNADRDGTESHIDDVLFEILEAETEGHLSTINDWIEGSSTSPQLVTEDLLRAFHTIRGGFAMVGVSRIGDVATAAEQLVSRLLFGRLVPTDEAVEALRATAASFRTCLEALRDSSTPIPTLTSLSASLTKLRDELPEIQSSRYSIDPGLAEACSMDFSDADPSLMSSSEPEIGYEARYIESYPPKKRPDGPPPWLIGFSKQFRKDTSGLDRKLMGRILEVLEEVADYTPPFSPRGDTFKPLAGELAGCWRYRLGDHRLVLQPLPARSQINVLTFAARGSVYE